MKFNQIVNYDINQNLFPSTKKFDLNQINNNTMHSFRSWNPFQSSLSASIISGLEIIPINSTSSLLYMGQLSYDVSLNLLDLVENKQKIFCIIKNQARFPNQENLVKINNFNRIKNQKFSVIYIDFSNYTYESIIDITDSYLENYGYLIIQFSKSSPNSNQLFKNLSEKFEIFQEVNIESFFRNKSLLILKSKN